MLLAPIDGVVLPTSSMGSSYRGKIFFLVPSARPLGVQRHRNVDAGSVLPAGRGPDGPDLATYTDSQSPAQLAGVEFCVQESRARAVGRRKDRRRRPDGPSTNSGVR